jgi:hypothetical protein
MTDWKSLDRYLILSSDAHAGAPMADYKRFLDARCTNGDVRRT